MKIKPIRAWAVTYLVGDERRIEPEWVGATRKDALYKAQGRLADKEFAEFKNHHEMKVVRIQIRVENKPARVRLDFGPRLESRLRKIADSSK